MRSQLKSSKRVFKKAFGEDEYGFALIPIHFSNVQLARLEWGEYMGCSRCFPHGFETVNARHKKIQRSWKQFRKTQYRM